MGNSSPVSRRPITTRNTAWAARCARWLAGAGATPNGISIASLFFAGGAAAAFLYAGREANSRALWLVLAAVAIQGRLLCNLFDGMVAIEGGKRTKTGEIYNELPDRISDSLILIAAGYGPGSEPLLGWLAALLAMLTAYVRALGVTVGGTQQFCGPMSKSHRMAVLTVAALVAAAWEQFVPGGVISSSRHYSIFVHVHWLEMSLVVICVGAGITAFRRILRTVRELEAK